MSAHTFKYVTFLDKKQRNNNYLSLESIMNSMCHPFFKQNTYILTPSHPLSSLLPPSFSLFLLNSSLYPLIIVQSHILSKYIAQIEQEIFTVIHKICNKTFDITGIQLRSDRGPGDHQTNVLILRGMVPCGQLKLEYVHHQSH